MYDYHDNDDYAQLRAYIRFRGATEPQCEAYIRGIKRKQARNIRLFKQSLDKIVTKDNEEDLYQRPLMIILDPDSKKLEAMPIYHRYIAYMLSKGSRQAAVHLGINRMTLWRWLKANHYYCNPKDAS